jgi:hypothetical protein
MRLICLKCAGPACSCGRLALARLVRELRDEDLVAARPRSVASNSAAEGGDAAAERDGLLVLKLRYNRDLPKAFRGE